MSNLIFLYKNWIEQSGTLLLNGPAVTCTNLDCTQTLYTITRASGSFIDDGVKVKALLSGTIAARFPAGTRVSTVAAMTLTMDGVAASNGPGTESGTFTPDCELIQDTTAPMANVLVPDRYVFWDRGAGTATASVLLDLGVARQVKMIGVLGNVTSSASTGGITSVNVYRSSSFLGAAPTWISTATLTPTSIFDRDFGTALGSAVTARYWKIAVNYSARASIGGIWLGLDDFDLGFEDAPGASMRVVANSTRASNPYTGAQQATRLGGEAAYWTLNWSAVGSSTRDSFLNYVVRNHGINGATYRTPIFIDASDLWNEVRFAGDAFNWSRTFINVDAMTIDLEGLP